MGTGEFEENNEVPEPSTVMLYLPALLIGIVAVRRRGRRSTAGCLAFILTI